MKVLSLVTTGGSMFLHAFGAYFGLAISLVMSKRDYDHPAIAGLQDSRLERSLIRKG